MLHQNLNRGWMAAVSSPSRGLLKDFYCHVNFHASRYASGGSSTMYFETLHGLEEAGEE